MSGWTKACIALALVVVLSSCSDGADGESTQSTGDEWVEPAWMAETKKNTFELSTKVTLCMADRGWDEKPERDGSFSISFTSEADAPRYLDDRVFCESAVREDLGITPVAHDDAFFETMYSQALDTRDCLVAHGVDVSEPPSDDEWIEALRSGSADVWAPFDDVTGYRIEFYELFDVCVQGGVEVTRR